MGTFDLFVIVVGVIGYGFGRAKGFVWQVSGILTLVVGAICATVLSKPLGNLFADGILGRFAAWVAVYAVVAFCLYVVSLRIRQRLEEEQFLELDRRYGGMLGTFQALFVFVVLVLMASPLSASIEKSVKGSASGRVLCKLVGALGGLLPERIQEALNLDSVQGGEGEEESDEKAKDGASEDADDEDASDDDDDDRPTPRPRPRPGPTPNVDIDDVPDDDIGPLDAELMKELGMEEDDVRKPREEPEDPFDTSKDPKDPLAPR